MIRRTCGRGVYALVSVILTLAAPLAAKISITVTVESFVASEIALEQSLESAYGEADSLIPIPDFDGQAALTRELTPRVDGSLEEDFWNHASSFLWTVVGDSSFRLKTDLRVHVAHWRGSLWLAGEIDRRDSETLTLLSGTDGEIFMSFFGIGGPRAVFQCSASTAPVEEHGAEFAAEPTDGGWHWELRVPESNGVWQLPLGVTRPLRIVARKLEGSMTVSPAFRLLPSDIALRVDGVAVTESRDVTAQVQVISYANESRTIRYDYNDEVEIGSGERRSRALKTVAAPNSRGLGWSFHVEHIACRVGLATAFVEPDRLRDRIRALVTRARANLGWLGSGREAWLPRVEGLEQRLSDVANASGEIENLFLSARLIARETLLARLPADLDEIVFVSRHPFRAGPFYTTYLNDMPGGGLGLYSLRTREATMGLQRKGESIRDLAVDFSSQRLVFAVRSAKDGTRLHVQDIESGARRAITDEPYHDLEPCFLPNGDVVFTSNRHGSQSPINVTDNFCLHVVSPETGAVRRLSFNNLMDFTPSVLDDGRILFLRWVHEDKPGNFINALWTVYPDGRGLSGFFGMNRIGVTIEPQPIPDTKRIVCIDSGANGHWRSPQVGALAVLDFGVSANEFRYSIERSRGGYKHPYPVAPEVFLVSAGWLDTRWAMAVVDRYGNEEVLYRDPQYSCFNPTPLRARPTPHVIPNLTSKDRKKPAKILIQDVYQGLPGVERGAAKKLRVVHSTEKPQLARHGFLDQTVPLGINNRALRRDLGTVPVHEDGSVHFEVPPNTNIFFQVLDERGRLIQTMRDSMSFAPGEFRACIGCHEDRSLAPVGEPVAMVDALRQAPARPDLGDFSEVVSFERDVQPILDRYCVECHDVENREGGVVLSGDVTPYFNLAYEKLVQGGESYQNQYSGNTPLARESAALAPAIQNVSALLPPLRTGSAVSPLMTLIDGDHHSVMVDSQEKALLARWIDFNRPYYGDWESGRLGEERRILSARSEDLISAIMRVRCRGCHVPTDLFRGASVNLSVPRGSAILRAPLPFDEFEGGTGLCRTTVFENNRDRDYRAILKTLEADSRRYREGRDR